MTHVNLLMIMWQPRTSMQSMSFSRNPNLCPLNLFIFHNVELLDGYNSFWMLNPPPHPTPPQRVFLRKGSHDRIRVGARDLQPLVGCRKTLLSLIGKHCLACPTSKKVVLAFLKATQSTKPMLCARQLQGPKSNIYMFTSTQYISNWFGFQPRSGNH